MAISRWACTTSAPLRRMNETSLGTAVGSSVRRDAEVLRLQTDLAQQRFERRAVRPSVEDAQHLQVEVGLSGDPAQLGDQGLGSAETEGVDHGENSQRTLLVVLHGC